MKRTRPSKAALDAAKAAAQAKRASIGLEPVPAENVEYEAQEAAKREKRTNTNIAPKTDNAWNELDALVLSFGQRHEYLPGMAAQQVAHLIAAHPSMIKTKPSGIEGKPVVVVEVNELWAEALGSDVVYFQPTGDGFYLAEC